MISGILTAVIASNENRAVLKNMGKLPMLPKASFPSSDNGSRNK